MIVPDEKNWTWVLERRCPQCGFDASTCAGSGVARLVRQNRDDWSDLFQSGEITSQRFAPSKWSSLEYACHVRDVFRLFDERIGLMETGANPQFANWDQDKTAIEDHYELQSPATVHTELIDAADILANHLDQIAGAGWERPGQRGDGASFTIDSIARYMIHDPVHHLWDVTADV